MQATPLKADIHQLVDRVDDKNFLSAIKELLKIQVKEKDFWDELSEEQQKAILKSLKQAKDGHTYPHAQVVEEAKAKYPFLK